jgi:hypothetical protein
VIKILWSNQAEVWCGICRGVGERALGKTTFCDFWKLGSIDTHTHTPWYCVRVRCEGYPIYRSPSTHTDGLSAPGREEIFLITFVKQTPYPLASTLISRSDQKKDWRKKKVIYFLIFIIWKSQSKVLSGNLNWVARLSTIDPLSVKYWRSGKYFIFYFNNTISREGHKTGFLCPIKVTYRRFAVTEKPI